MMCNVMCVTVTCPGCMKGARRVYACCRQVCLRWPDAEWHGGARGPGGRGTLLQPVVPQ